MKMEWILRTYFNWNYLLNCGISKWKTEENQKRIVFKTKKI